MWQSPGRAAKAGCPPSANMNSEGTWKQVPPLHNQPLPPWSIPYFTHPFLVMSSLCSLAEAETEDHWASNSIWPLAFTVYGCLITSSIAMAMHCSWHKALQDKLILAMLTDCPLLMSGLLDGVPRNVVLEIHCALKGIPTNCGDLLTFHHFHVLYEIARHVTDGLAQTFVFHGRHTMYCTLIT